MIYVICLFSSGSVLSSFVAISAVTRFRTHLGTNFGFHWSVSKEHNVGRADEGTKRATDNHQLTPSSTDQCGNNTGSSRDGRVLNIRSLKMTEKLLLLIFFSVFFCAYKKFFTCFLQNCQHKIRGLSVLSMAHFQWLRLCFRIKLSN